MIKKENIKQAIDAISEWNSGIGYSLDEMLGRGRISVSLDSDDVSNEAGFFLHFDNHKLFINKYNYLSDGVAAVAQRLLIKYGEMFQKQELSTRGDSTDYIAMSRQIREAGLRLVVEYEIDRAVAHLSNALSNQRDINRLENIIVRLKKIKQDDPASKIPGNKNDAGVLYTGIVGGGATSHFVRFPFCMDSLMQTADMNLEFFHVRFLLNCLIRGQEQNLFACVVGKKISGLIFLGLKKELFSTRLEVKYIATLGGKSKHEADSPAISMRGTGAFLMAGTWLLWKNYFPGAIDIFLDSEIAANRFYKSIGFHSLRPYQYVLKKPGWRILKNILIIAEHSEKINEDIILEISGCIGREIKSLTKMPRGGKEAAKRDAVINFVKMCLAATSHPGFATTAVKMLLRYVHRIPEAEELIAFGTEYGRVRLKQKTLPEPAVVVIDARYCLHLENIFHLENPKRIKAIQSILADVSLTGRWLTTTPRHALPEEIALVHTPEYIRRVAQTAGKPMTSLDLDTQTTAKSYETALLAAGGVFSLLDEIWSKAAKRGFAFIRPPGHHAGPDNGMGFCLFNNIALGAGYLKKTYFAEKIMIIDIDVHHGNGTQTAFYDTDDVLFVSMHQFPGYPGTGNLGESGTGKGEGYTVNIPLKYGLGDRDIARIIYFLISPLAREYQPDIILVSCGFDLYIHDPLGKMSVTPEGYGLITFFLIEMAEEVCNGRIAFIMEGGYSIKGIEACGLKVMQEICGRSGLTKEKIDRVKNFGPERLSFIKKSVEIQKKYWECLR